MAVSMELAAFFVDLSCLLCYHAFVETDASRNQKTMRSTVMNNKPGGHKVMSIIKKEAKKLIDRLPDQATWDDIMYEFYVKKKLAIALKAAEEGNVVSHKQVKKRLLSN